MSFCNKRILPEWMVKLRLTSKSANNEQKYSLTTEERLVLTFEGTVNYLNTLNDCRIVCNNIHQSLGTLDKLVIGFDMEWPVYFTKGKSPGSTALIQMCPNLELCYLFHVSQWNELPLEFISLLSHPKVLLTGLNISGDMWKLAKDFDVSVHSIVKHNILDLSTFANQVLGCRHQWSLARLVLYVLKKHLKKPSYERISDWAKEVLTPRQIQYAATDAYASLLVYKELKKIEKKKTLNTLSKVHNKEI